MPAETRFPLCGECRLEEITFHGWPAVRLSNGLVTAVAVPELGGRVMSLTLGPYEYLFMNQALAGKQFTPEEHFGDGSLTAWKNYGGDKTWPAPQGWERGDQWPGPPDPILDSGPYQAQTFTDGRSVGLAMVSPPDLKHTGLRIHRRLTLKPQAARLQLQLMFENVVDRPIRWSIWEVAQMDCARPAGPNTDCWVYIPTAPEVTAERPYQILYGDENPQWRAQIVPGLMGVHYLGYVGKIGVASPAGWMAFANESAGYVLCACFAYEAGAEYPDGGASVEVWTESPSAPSPVPIRSPGYLLEVEVLGPLHSLQPGERTSLGLEWGLARCPGPVVQANAAGCVHVPLTVTRDREWAWVQGVFGCFEVGEVELAWLDRGGHILEQRVLQAASPQSVLWLDTVTPLPSEAIRGRLQLRRLDGSLSGPLAEGVIRHDRA